LIRWKRGGKGLDFVATVCEKEGERKCVRRHTEMEGLGKGIDDVGVGGKKQSARRGIADPKKYRPKIHKKE